jgi:hypothetical protein
MDNALDQNERACLPCADVLATAYRIAHATDNELFIAMPCDTHGHYHAAMVIGCSNFALLNSNARHFKNDISSLSEEGLNKCLLPA